MASVALEDVGVHFLLPQGKSAGLLGSVRSIATGGIIRREHGRVGVTAIEGVTFTLKDGDRLGIIGHNGAGKTTLLRVLAGILPPTSGRIRTVGRVSALMSINLGLDNHASGYENIRIRARYMGYSEEEIAARFDDIAAFCALDDYLDLPIRSYSAGMRLRLSFAIATAFSPDILILDEWLSAGDADFKKKAGDRLRGLIDRTGILAFASHNEAMQARMCNKGLVLEHGRIAYFGSIDEAIAVGKGAEKAEAARLAARRGKAERAALRSEQRRAKSKVKA